MLHLIIPETEAWDEVNEMFVYFKSVDLTLEHSLVSISKWEAKWHKPYLYTDNKTDEETIDYIRCMTITRNVDPNVYYRLSDIQLNTIYDYINDPHTATTFRAKHSGQTSSELVTSETIYYWMASYNIPFECAKWHLGRLLALIQMCNVKNQKPKKMTDQEIFRQNTDLNARRKKALHSRG